MTGLLPPFITKDGSPGGQFEGHAWVCSHNDYIVNFISIFIATHCVFAHEIIILKK